MQPVPAPGQVQRPTPHSASQARLTAVLQVVTALAVLAILVLLSWHPLEDLDIWFHHRAGADLLADGPLPPHNTYSFTEPRHPWLNHEWLFQLLAHATGPRGPVAALEVRGWSLLGTILAMGIGLALLAGDGGLRRFKGRGHPAAVGSAGLLLLATLGLVWPRLLLRPELLSYLALVLLVRWTEAWRMAVERDGHLASSARRWLDPRRPAGRTWWLVLRLGPVPRIRGGCAPDRRCRPAGLGSGPGSDSARSDGLACRRHRPTCNASGPHDDPQRLAGIRFPLARARPVQRRGRRPPPYDRRVGSAPARAGDAQHHDWVVQGEPRHWAATRSDRVAHRPVADCSLDGIGRCHTGQPARRGALRHRPGPAGAALGAAGEMVTGRAPAAASGGGSGAGHAGSGRSLGAGDHEQPLLPRRGGRSPLRRRTGDRTVSGALRGLARQTAGPRIRQPRRQRPAAGDHPLHALHRRAHRGLLAGPLARVPGDQARRRPGSGAPGCAQCRGHLSGRSVRVVRGPAAGSRGLASLAGRDGRGRGGPPATRTPGFRSGRRTGARRRQEGRRPRRRRPRRRQSGACQPPARRTPWSRPRRCTAWPAMPRRRTRACRMR